ncbi:hypothetical protein MaMV-DH010062 [Cyanophage MaMV-DH01]|nr:hypothetical protein MaMV-DH010062 [Cyanophage MaMV-DH01]
MYNVYMLVLTEYLVSEYDLDLLNIWPVG